MPSPVVLSKVSLPRSKLQPTTIIILPPGLQNLGGELRVEVLHTALPRQPRSDETPGAHHLHHQGRRQDCHQETQLPEQR